MRTLTSFVALALIGLAIAACSNSSSPPRIPGSLGNLPSTKPGKNVDSDVDSSSDMGVGDGVTVDAATDTAVVDATVDGVSAPDTTRDLALTICINACGCTQGSDCINSVCTPATPPVYCCENAGCPSGLACIAGNGAQGTCP